MAIHDHVSGNIIYIFRAIIPDCRYWIYRVQYYSRMAEGGEDEERNVSYSLYLLLCLNYCMADVLALGGTKMLI